MFDFFENENIEDIIKLINEYSIEHDDCGRIDCLDCSFLKNCYYVAKQKENSEWAELVNYGGCNTEEEFWEQLLN